MVSLFPATCASHSHWRHLRYFGRPGPAVGFFALGLEPLPVGGHTRNSMVSPLVSCVGPIGEALD
jgi:hypothetical protein